MEILKEKGCVYFLRHIGLEPVKIGYSSKPSPIKRFEHFKTFAPFGAELLGFIICENAQELESKLHQKYSHLRLEGEWFNISEELVNKEIEIKTSKEVINFKNNLQIKLANEIKEITSPKEKEVFEKEIPTKDINSFKTIYKQLNPNSINKTQLAKQFGVSRVTIQKWIKKLN